MVEPNDRQVVIFPEIAFPEFGANRINRNGVGANDGKILGVFVQTGGHVGPHLKRNLVENIGLDHLIPTGKCRAADASLQASRINLVWG